MTAYLSPEPLLQSPTFTTSMAARGMPVPTCRRRPVSDFVRRSWSIGNEVGGGLGVAADCVPIGEQRVLAVTGPIHAGRVRGEAVLDAPKAAAASRLAAELAPGD